jgi:hypothetical protein
VLNDTKFIALIAKHKRHNWLDLASEQVARDLLSFFRKLFQNHQAETIKKDDTGG